MRAKARNIIQPHARRSASAGYEVATNLPAAEAVGTTPPNSQHKRDLQQLLWRPPPRPHFHIPTDTPRSRCAERGAGLWSTPSRASERGLASNRVWFRAKPG